MKSPIRTTTTDSAGPSGLAFGLISRREMLGTAGAALALSVGSSAAAERSQSSLGADTEPASLLYPHESVTRRVRDLSGLWRFALDPEDSGEARGWTHGLPAGRWIPVPCSWNDLFDDAKNYFGAAWY